MEISVGAILEGTIKSITKFGAFVSLPGGRSGLVHISEIDHSYVEARLKQFMQASDSRLSDLKLNEKRSSRRGHR